MHIKSSDVVFFKNGSFSIEEKIGHTASDHMLPVTLFGGSEEGTYIFSLKKYRDCFSKPCVHHPDF